jgi:hypothetical protein
MSSCIPSLHSCACRHWVAAALSLPGRVTNPHSAGLSLRIPRSEAGQQTWHASPWLSCNCRRRCREPAQKSPWCFMRCHTFLPILRFPAYVPVCALVICQAFSVRSVSITVHQCVPCASCAFNTSTHGWPQFSTKRDREHTPPRPSR